MPRRRPSQPVQSIAYRHGHCAADGRGVPHDVAVERGKATEPEVDWREGDCRNLEDTYERRVVVPTDEDQPAVYGDVPLGLYIVRGDSVVLLGEIGPERESSPEHPQQLPIGDVVALEESGAGETAVVWDIEDC